MRKRNLFLIFLIWCFAFITLLLLLWTTQTEEEAHFVPEYEQMDLTHLLQKDCLEEADYELLFQQTGLAKVGVEQLFESGRQEQLLYLQQRLFAPVTYECHRRYIFCHSETLIGQNKNNTKSVAEKGMSERSAGDEGEGDEGDLKSRNTEDNCAFCPAAQDGDILVTFSGHLFGWRSGHAGLVIDAEGGKTLEAITIGQNSQIRSLNSWQDYPGFAVLRLKGTDKEKRGEIAAYAAQNLTDISYNLLSFCERSVDTEKHSWNKSERGAESEEYASKWSENASERKGTANAGDEYEDMPAEYAGTHCAHLVWLAYSKFGYNLDSDGGYIVTPRDLYESDLLELVQIYGISPE